MSRPKNILKVLKERLSNPLDTTREVANKTGIDHSTVARIDKQLPRIATKDERILAITETDINIVALGQKEIDRRLSNNEELSKMRTVEISQVIRESTARYSLFKGDATDENGGAKNITSIEIL